MSRTGTFEPWNKGKAQGQKTPFTVEQVRTIKALLAADRSVRDLALFSVAIDTMLRGIDLLALQVGDCTSHTGQVRAEFEIRQQKTGKPVLVALSPSTVTVLQDWIQQADLQSRDFVFVRLRGAARGQPARQPISTRSLRRLVKKWAAMARLDPGRYSTHSLRRTKAMLVYEQTGNVEAVRLLLGQGSTAATSHYLGVSRRDALELARKIRF